MAPRFWNCNDATVWGIQPIMSPPLKILWDDPRDSRHCNGRVNGRTGRKQCVHLPIWPGRYTEITVNLSEAPDECCHRNILQNTSKYKFILFTALFCWKTANNNDAAVFSEPYMTQHRHQCHCVHIQKYTQKCVNESKSLRAEHRNWYELAFEQRTSRHVTVPHTSVAVWQNVDLIIVRSRHQVSQQFTH